MPADMPSHGLWLLVVRNSAVFLMVAFSFTQPHRVRERHPQGDR
jgi:hypothetical protein